MTESPEKRVRTCVGCGAKADKVNMHRVVRLPEGQVVYDASGRLPGRGAYVCSKECFEQALAKNRVARALKAELRQDEASAIASELEGAQTGARAR